jgi:hypothetical protein
MNPQTPPSIRCPHCKLINFSDVDTCKRCKNPLPHFSVDREPGTININISMPQAVAVQTPVPRTTSRPQEPRYQGEYQVQNQTGFRQWQQINEPPPAPTPFFPEQNYGVWRRGTEIVMHKLAPLPATCVKCGASAELHAGGSFHRHKFRWHHPAVYAAIISPIIYAILATVLSHRFPLDVPLCGDHGKARSDAGKLLGIAGVIGVILVILSFAAGWAGTGILLSLGTIIGLAIYYEHFYKALRVSRLEGDIAFIKGGDEAFLRQLPMC